MARGSEDWRGGVFAPRPPPPPPPPPPQVRVHTPSFALSKVPPASSSFAAPIMPSSSASVYSAIWRASPGGPAPSTSTFYQQHGDAFSANSHSQSHSRSSESPSPFTRQRSRSTSAFERSPSTTSEDDPILPHTQPYHNAIRSASTSHDPSYTSFPSFISSSEPTPPPPPPPPRLPRSHSQPVGAAQSQGRSRPSSPSKTKSRPSSPSKRPKSRPSSPTKQPKSRPSFPSKPKPPSSSSSRTPTPPHVVITRTHTSPQSHSHTHASADIHSRSQPPSQPSSFSQNQSQVQAQAQASRSRPTTPSPPTFAIPSQPGGRSRIPQRPRAYSASAAEALETLTETPPPLPPLPLPGLDHARALESALKGVSHSHNKPYTPRQAFPAQSAHPEDMSVSSTRAPEAPHRLHGNHSGIPVLKSRVRSSPRSPSPDFPDSAERLADELPPFRVDLDAALAEIEDELEVRAHERYTSAQPAPRTPNSAVFATMTAASTSTSTVGSASGVSVSKIRPPKVHSRPSLPATLPQNGSATPNSRKAKRAGSVPLTPNTPMTPKTLKDGGLGRAASYSVSPEGGHRSKSMPRRRHGSESTAQTLTFGGHPRPAPAMSTPPAGRRDRDRDKERGMKRSTSVSNPITPPTQTQSKLGVAAHFVPPENSFTPPKGADWDDVVLPTVARKTGITVASSQQGHSYGHERVHSHSFSYSQSYEHALSSNDDMELEADLLAVEWDKEGMPIRWERQRHNPGLSEDDFAANRAASGAIYDDFGQPRPQPQPQSQSNSKRQSRQSLKAQQDIEMAPLRSSAAPATALKDQRPSKPPRAAGRSTQHSPQPNAQSQAQQQQQNHMSLPRPMEVAPPLPLKDAKRKKRKNEDDIKSSGCACVIM